MDFKIETVDDAPLERRITVTIPAATIDEAVKTRLRERGRTAKLHGFRPGKIPPNVLEQHYGAETRMAVYDQEMRTSYGEALAKEEVRAAGGPTITDTTMEPGKDFSYTATFEVYPEVKVTDLNSLTIDKPVVAVTDEDVEDMLGNLREQRAEWNVVERAAEDGDQVKIDFEGKIDGEAFEGGTAEGVAVTLGAGGMIPEFEDGLKGLKAGDEKTYTVNFPEDYHVDTLAGKETEFSVKVHDVSEKSLPELDDEFANSLGFEEGGLDKLREVIKENMAKDSERGVEGQVKSNVVDAMLAANEVALPKALVRDEIGRLRHEMQHQSGQGDCNDHDDEGFPDDMFFEEAERRVKLGLLMGQVIEDADLTVNAEQVNERLAQISAGQAGDPQKAQEMMRAYRGNPQVMRNIEAGVLEQQVIDYVLEQAQVNEVSKSFKEIAPNL